MKDYFAGCGSIDALKARYYALARENHPDRGGSLETMKAINAQYTERLERIKRGQDVDARRNGGPAPTDEVPEEFIRVVDALFRIDAEITIELCGSWLWISGDTRACKERLKAAGCRWSRSKQMWYWRHASSGRRYRKGGTDMDTIRATYGSKVLRNSAPIARAS